MKFLLPVFFLFPGIAFSAGDVGFSSGASMHSVPVSGRVTVFCPRGPTNPTPLTAVYGCQGIILEPSAYDYFMGPKGVAADSVTLIATREDGSARVTNSDYDGALTRSTSALNLWISTLFQRPLLKKGLNKIKYTMALNKVIVGQGAFEVLIQEQPARECPVSEYVSADPADCSSPFSVCERYYLQYNNCTLN